MQMQIEQIKSKEKESKSRKDLSILLLPSTLRLLFNRLSLGLSFSCRLSLVSSRRSRLSRSSSSWLSGGLRSGVLFLWGRGFARMASSSSGFLWLLLFGLVIIRFFSVVGSRFFVFFFLRGFLAAGSSLGLFGGGLLLFLVFVFVLSLWFGGFSAAAFLGFRSFLLFLGGVVLFLLDFIYFCYYHLGDIPLQRRPSYEPGSHSYQVGSFRRPVETTFSMYEKVRRQVKETYPIPIGIINMSLLQSTTEFFLEVLRDLIITINGRVVPFITLAAFLINTFVQTGDDFGGDAAPCRC